MVSGVRAGRMGADMVGPAGIPSWGDPFSGDIVDVRTVDRYEAMAEVIMGRGPKLDNELRALDARSVIETVP